MHIRNVILFFILVLISINLSSASYTLIGDVVYRDSDNVLKPVPYAAVEVYNSTWGYRVIADANGHYISAVPGQSAYYITVTRAGYTTTTFVKWMNADESNYDIIIEKEVSPNYIMPHYVKFTVQNLWGTEQYKNVNVNVYSNGTSILTGTTGNAGGFGAMLSENQKYRITFINNTQGINREWYDYPTDSSYKIIVFSTMLPEERQVDDILFGLEHERINVSSGYVNVTYNDTSATTSSAVLKIYQGTVNGTLFYSATSLADSGSWSIITPANNTNYTVQFTIDNSQIPEPLVITRFITFYDENRFDMGFDNGWNYILISVCIIIGIFALFSRVNAEIGSVVGVFAGWFLWMIGWLNNGMDTDARLTMGLMMMLATMVSIGAYIRKGEDI